MSDVSDKLKSLSIDRSGSARPHGRGHGILIAAILALAGAIGFGAWAIWHDQPGAPGAIARNGDAETAAPAAPAPAAAPDAAARQTPPSSGAPPAARRGDLVASGYVVARRRATVSSEITGRVIELLVEEGDRVEEGQVLARLDAELAEIDLALLRARAESADAAAEAIAAELPEARRALERSQELVASNFTSEATVDVARARVAGLEARLRGARADAEAAARSADRQEELVSRYTVRAPFSGVIIDKNAQPGEIVSPTSAGGGFTRTGVYTLVDMDSLEIEVDVNEGQIQRVSAGDRVEAVLDAYPDWRISARVAAIIPTADRNRATIQVRVAFDEIDERILPDMAARVTFLGGR